MSTLTRYDGKFSLDSRFAHRSTSLSKEAWKSNYMAACDSFGYPEVALRLERAPRAHAELFADFARSSLKGIPALALTWVSQKKFRVEMCPGAQAYAGLNHRITDWVGLEGALNI